MYHPLPLVTSDNGHLCLITLRLLLCSILNIQKHCNGISVAAMTLDMSKKYRVMKWVSYYKTDEYTNMVSLLYISEY